jgi:hypothetical protein
MNCPICDGSDVTAFARLPLFAVAKCAIEVGSDHAPRVYASAIGAKA